MNVTSALRWIKKYQLDIPQNILEDLEENPEICFIELKDHVHKFIIENQQELATNEKLRLYVNLYQHLTDIDEAA